MSAFDDKNEKDDFWNIEKLLPKKKNTPLKQFSASGKTVDHFISTTEAPKSRSETKLTSVHDITYTTEEYTLNEGFIKRVRLKRRSDNYNFYGNFKNAVISYFDYKSEKCDFVPFYCYLPQYSQFNNEQKKYYFYFRDSVRRGEYVKTDYSYLFLYAYEIINLPDKIPPKEGLKILLELWRAYRDALPKIDSNMCIWIEDYCLVWGLPAPVEEMVQFAPDIILQSGFKEFYLNTPEKMEQNVLRMMISCLSDYKFSEGRYSVGEHAETYYKHLLGAMKRVLLCLWSRGEVIDDDAKCSRFSRHAFKNALVTPPAKCAIEADYISFVNIPSLRRKITSSVRYCENKIRAFLGVKSRLSVHDASPYLSSVIDDYFNELKTSEELVKKKSAEPLYERLYDAENTVLSFEGADAIERASWSTTARLVSEDGLADEMLNTKTDGFKPEDKEISNGAVSNISTEAFGLSELEIDFTEAVFKLDGAKQKALADIIGKPIESVIDRVNEAFVDGFGDVVIEPFDGQYRIIDDYSEDINKWLMKMKK